MTDEHGRLRICKTGFDSLVRYFTGLSAACECGGIARDFAKVVGQVRFLDGLLGTGYALRVWRTARQTTNLQDEVRLLGGVLEKQVLGV